MADRTMKQGATWPPLKGWAADENGLVNLTTAQALAVILKSATHEIVPSGVPTVINPPEVDGAVSYNWQYVFAVGETDVPGDYTVLLKVTRATGEIDIFPNTGGPVLTIEAV